MRRGGVFQLPPTLRGAQCQEVSDLCDELEVKRALLLEQEESFLPSLLFSLALLLSALVWFDALAGHTAAVYLLLPCHT